MDRQLDTEMNRETESQTETKRQSLAPIPSPNSSPCRLSWHVSHTNKNILCSLMQLPSTIKINPALMKVHYKNSSLN